MSLSPDSKIHPSIACLSKEEFFQERCDHEAGHYVMLHLLKVWHISHYVSVKEVGDVAGGVVNFSFDKKMFTLRMRILQSVGGIAAQAQGIFGRKGIVSGDHPEMPLIRERLNVCGQRDLIPLKEDFGIENVDKEIHEAQQMLSDGWHLVEAVSGELSREKILYSDEARIVIEIAEGNRARESLLYAYRKHRAVFDESDRPAVFAQDYPDEDWCESVSDFHDRFDPEFDCECDDKCRVIPYNPAFYDTTPPSLKASSQEQNPEGESGADGDAAQE